MKELFHRKLGNVSEQQMWTETKKNIILNQLL